MPNPLISLDRISVRFPLGRKRCVTAVDHVSLTLHEGETLGLIGESGSGKSTLARALVGLTQTTTGSIFWDGGNVSNLSRSARQEFIQKVQMVFQDPHSALDPRRTVLRSVREPLDVMNQGIKNDRWNMAEQALTDVGLSTQIASRYPHQLSGGQKQRANIARALVTNPRVLICDESVASLDVALQAEVLNLLQELKRTYGLTMMFISHDLGVVAHIADRINVMYLGEIVENSNTEELVTRPRHPYSEALLSAQPGVNQSASRRRVVLDGDIPSPVSLPPGCRFHTRCPYAQYECRQESPELIELAPTRFSSCLRVNELYPAQEDQGATT